MQALRNAQELFEDLQLSSALHEDGDSSISADRILEQKLESVSHRRISESISVEEEITKLISFFVNQRPQQKVQNNVIRVSSANATAAILPPPVKYSRASRKAVAKPSARAHEHLEM